MGCIASYEKDLDEVIESVEYKPAEKRDAQTSIGKDFDAYLEQQLAEDDDEDSYGYFSGSLTTATTESSSASAKNDLYMEICMMSDLVQIMPKTSSPYVTRRIYSQREQVQNQTYMQWMDNLQETPPCAMQNVTRIPEAISGQFTPEGFPAFTDAKTMLYLYRRGRLITTEL